MLIKNEDGTCTGGPLDVILILKDSKTERYHTAFFEEHPFPGPVKNIEDLDIVRLKSKMHHTKGAETFEETLEHLEDFAKKIHLPEGNIFRESAVDWDGKLGIVYIVSNWRKRGKETSFKPPFVLTL